MDTPLNRAFSFGVHSHETLSLMDWSQSPDWANCLFHISDSKVSVGCLTKNNLIVIECLPESFTLKSNIGQFESGNLKMDFNLPDDDFFSITPIKKPLDFLGHMDFFRLSFMHESCFIGVKNHDFYVLQSKCNSCLTGLKVPLKILNPGMSLPKIRSHKSRLYTDSQWQNHHTRRQSDQPLQHMALR